MAAPRGIAFGRPLRLNPRSGAFHLMRELFGYVSALWRDTPGPIKTIVIAAIGAIIGAWLASRAQAKRRAIEELRAVRAALALCFSISNKSLAVKRQHTRRMKKDHHAAVANFQSRQPGVVIPISLDMQTMSPLKFPGEVLEKIIFEKCSVGRGSTRHGGLSQRRSR
jgi:hypothetical protein